MDAQRCPEARAKNLLHRILPEGQWEQFSETGTLEILGSRGTLLDVPRCRAHASRRISIRDLTRVLDAQTRRPRASTCLQLTIPAPVHDRIIAEYMLIQNDEDLYWRTANIFPAGLDNRVPTEVLLAALDALLLILLFAQLRG
jgi:hypothetical protein